MEPFFSPTQRTVSIVAFECGLAKLAAYSITICRVLATLAFKTIVRPYAKKTLDDQSCDLLSSTADDFRSLVS